MMNQALMDRLGCFDDLFPRFRKECDHGHVSNRVSVSKFFQNVIRAEDGRPEYQRFIQALSGALTRRGGFTCEYLCRRKAQFCSVTIDLKPSAQADDKFFRKLLANVIKAWETQDPSKATPFYSKKADLFYDFAPLKYTVWKEYASRVQKIFFDTCRPTAPNLISDDFKVKRYGNAAITTTRWHHPYS